MPVAPIHTSKHQTSFFVLCLHEHSFLLQLHFGLFLADEEDHLPQGGVPVLPRAKHLPGGDRQSRQAAKGQPVGAQDRRRGRRRRRHLEADSAAAV